MKRIYNLTEGSILKKLLMVALPVLLTTITQMAYNLTDMFWIGRVDNIGMDEASAITAIGTASYVTWLAFGLAMIAKIGTSVKTSHSVGEKKNHFIDVYATNGLFLELLLGLFASVMIVLFKGGFLSIFNIQNPLVTEYALMYIPIVGGLMFIQFLSNGFVAINEGLGQTRINLVILAIGFGLNIVLDPLMILVFRWGIYGAAIATVLAQTVTLLIFYVVYRKHNPNHHIFKFQNIDPFAIKDILRVGLPVGLHSMLFTCISIYIATLVFKFGDDVVGAQRIGTQVEQLTWMIGSGFQTAITVFVGQNFGARLFGRIKRGILYISLILIPYAFLIAALLYFQAGWLMRIFVDNANMIAIGINYLKIISVAQAFMMMEAIGAGIFNGLGKSMVPSVTGIVGNILRIPFAIWLSIKIGESGIWWSLNISDIFKGLILFGASMYLFTRIERLRSRESIQVLEVTG